MFIASVLICSFKSHLAQCRLQLMVTMLSINCTEFMTKVIFTHTCTHRHTHTHNCFTDLFNSVRDHPGIQVSRHQKGKTRKVKPIWIYWSKRQWVAVASAWPYASHILSQKRCTLPLEQLSTLYFTNGCRNSILDVCFPNSISSWFNWRQWIRTVNNQNIMQQLLRTRV